MDLSAVCAAAAIDAALEEASAIGVAVTIVALDASGNTKAAVRMDGAPLASVQTAAGKAYGAVAIGMPTDDYYDAFKNDAPAVASFATRPGWALAAGGLPVVVHGVIVAGIGVAGAMTGAEDHRIASVACAADY